MCLSIQNIELTMTLHELSIILLNFRFEYQLLFQISLSRKAIHISSWKRILRSYLLVCILNNWWSLDNYFSCLYTTNTWIISLTCLARWLYVHLSESKLMRYELMTFLHRIIKLVILISKTIGIDIFLILGTVDWFWYLGPFIMIWFLDSCVFLMASI